MVSPNARRFEIGMWTFLATTLLGLFYAIIQGASFFPASGKAVFQAARLIMSDGVSGYGPYLNKVLDTWPERLAAYPVSAGAFLAVLLVFLLAFGCFRLMQRPPRGVALEKLFPAGTPAGERLLLARRLAGFDGRVLERTDGAPYADGIGNAVFLPKALTRRLDRPLLSGVPGQIAFVLKHETTHSSTSDNLLWGLGNTLTALLIGVAGFLIALPLLCPVALAMPGRLISLAPVWVCFAFVFAVTAVMLAFVGLAVAGLLPNLVAAREFFADREAAASVGLASLPQAGQDDPEQVGVSYESWLDGVPPPDRRLHTLGIAPRTTALAAAAVGTWVITRTLLLMLAHSADSVATTVFDVASLGSAVVMLQALPAGVVGSRDYGMPPWTVAFALPVVLMGAFAEIRFTLMSLGLPPVVTPHIVATAGELPLLASALIWVWLRTRRRAQQPSLSPVDSAPPRKLGLGRILRVLLSVPAFIFSYSAGGFLLLSAAQTVGYGLAGEYGPRPILLQNLSFLAVELPMVMLIAVNMARPMVWSASVEACLVAFAAGAVLYINFAMRALAVQSVPGMSGAPVDNEPLLSRLALFPAGPVEKAVLFFLVSLLVLAISWPARYGLSYDREYSDG